jgi:hypothetical protein
VGAPEFDWEFPKDADGELFYHKSQKGFFRNPPESAPREVRITNVANCPIRVHVNRYRSYHIASPEEKAGAQGVLQPGETGKVWSPDTQVLSENREVYFNVRATALLDEQTFEHSDQKKWSEET